MKIDAVIYESQTGHTRRYAELLGKKAGKPVYSLKEGIKSLPRGSGVFFCGWLMGGLVRGLHKAEGHFTLRGVVACGMGEKGSQLPEIRKMNRLSSAIPLFTLQGGYREEALPLFYRLMMKPVKKALVNSLSEKKERSVGEENSLTMLTCGGDFVTEEGLDEILALFQE